MARAQNGIVAGRSSIQAVSRHPRLGSDYNPVSHTYKDGYLNPPSYGIEVDVFPGKTLMVNRGDQQLPPGGDPDKIRDIYRLDARAGTTGWNFSIVGRPARKLPVGPRPKEFKASGSTRLVTLQGIFHEERKDNAWNWRFDVPGPGMYTVTVDTLGGARVLSTVTAKLAVRDKLVVSIGDSAASGQGNPDIPGAPDGFDPEIEWWEVFVPAVAVYKLTKEALDWSEDRILQAAPTIARAGEYSIDMDPEPTWLEPAAYRSLCSGHAYAARQLEDRKKGTLVTFLPFGRTGSNIPNGLIGPRMSNNRPSDPWIGNRGQIDEVLRTIGQRQIDALLIHIGVNDLSVAATLKNLVKNDSPILGDGDATANRRAVEAKGRANLAALPARLQALAAALGVLNVRHIYLTEYPVALFDDNQGNPRAGCGIFSGPQLNLSLRDAQLVKTLSTELNTVLKDEAKKLGWFFVGGIAAQFAGHGYCASDRWFVSAAESLAVQGDTEGTIHPNTAGAMAIGSAVAKMVKKNTFDTDGTSPVDLDNQVVLGTGGRAGAGRELTSDPSGAPGGAGLPVRPRPRTRKAADAPVPTQ